MALIARLPETLCSMKFFTNHDTYVAKIFAGKKHFIGTLCVVDPHPSHLSLTSHGIEQIFVLEGNQYEFTRTVSRNGLPKLTARYTDESVNSLFVKYTVPSEDHKLRWVKIHPAKILTQAGFITDPIKNLRAQFFGVLPLGSKINLVDSSNEVVKTIIIKPGGYNEEIGCVQSGNTTSLKNSMNRFLQEHY